MEDEHRDLPAVPGERRVAVQLGDLFGLDVRPGRTGGWRGRPGGGGGGGGAATPVQSKHVGPAEITYVGSPAYTLPLSLTLTAKHLWRRHKAKRDASGGGR